MDPKGCAIAVLGEDIAEIGLWTILKRLGGGVGHFDQRERRRIGLGDLLRLCLDFKTRWTSGWQSLTSGDGQRRQQ